MGFSPGEESRDDGVAAQAIDGAAGPRPDLAITRRGVRVLNSIIGEDAGGHGVCKDGGRFRVTRHSWPAEGTVVPRGNRGERCPHPSSPFRRPATSELPIDNAPTTGAPPSWGEARIVNCAIVSSPPPARRLSARQGRCHKSTWRISDIRHARPVRRGAVAWRKAPGASGRWQKPRRDACRNVSRPWLGSRPSTRHGRPPPSQAP
jgi:hypothetical protein